MNEADEPRVYVAAERTLLAWVRTGLTVIAIGFVVARFGLFLRVMRNAPPNAATSSTVIGVTLMLLGAMAIGGAAWQHVRFCRTLMPPHSRIRITRVGPYGSPQCCRPLA